tara:strand:- start:23 stop:364 length:342 start_codon:yes stop_codon:yes gene_type:complete
MKIKLHQIACTRSGDKGKNSNVGVIFDHKQVYEWAKKTLTSELVKIYFNDIVLGEVLRYELDNLLSLNFILKDSLGGGGSESLLNDAQGKTHGQILLQMNLDFPDKLKEFINE